MAGLVVCVSTAWVFAPGVRVSGQGLPAAGTAGSPTITAAVIASIVIDHFGLVGFRQHSAGVWRIVGAAPMIGGLGLATRFRGRAAAAPYPISRL